MADQAEDMAEMLEFIAMRVRRGLPCHVGIQAIWNDGDGQVIFHSSERTESHEGVLALIGLMSTRQTELAQQLRSRHPPRNPVDDVS